MSKNKFSLSEERALGCSIMSVILMDIAAKTLRQNNKFYQHNVKNWISKWKDIAAPTLWQIEKLRKLFVNKEELNKIETEVGELEAEAIENDLNEESTLFTNFIALYLQSNTSEIYSLNLVIDNLLRKEKIYTEQEMKDMINNVLKTTTPSVKYEENVYKRFLI